MQNRMIDAPLLNLISYGRRGPGQRDRLTLGQVQQIARTVGRAPEVMIKVLPMGASTVKAVRDHLTYIGREGEVDLEAEDGEKSRGKDASALLLEDWDLELDQYRRQTHLAASRGRAPPKLVHKLVFSMPAGTPPEKVLGAVRNFCREEFALKQRYVMTLHTDEPHPHVHVVIKAMGQQGQRLNIRKATLREWRRGFAKHLNDLGVEANATQRSIRGVTGLRKLDSIYRPMRDPKRHSTHLARRAQAVALEIRSGKLAVEPGKAKLLKTRKLVVSGWSTIHDALVREGRLALAGRVKRFVGQMAPPRTDNELIASKMLEDIRKPKVVERVHAR